jgi:hypothetical protein
MSANQDYSGDDDSLCYSASITNENDSSLDISDTYFETLDTKEVVVIFGDGFNPRQQQHDVKSQKEQSSKPFGRQVRNSRPSNKNMQYKEGQSFHPKPSGHITFHAPMQAAISLK